MQMHKWPTSFQTTDCVIINREKGTILLGKKPNQPKWRFPGGFVDPNDASLEEACKRERIEECGLDMECSYPEYLFSFRINDPRYNQGPDKILTAVCKCFYLWGIPKVGDDLAEVRWFTKTQLRKQKNRLVMPEHVPLIDSLIQRNII